jgi:broad specificity phosphatase PhoE
MYLLEMKHATIIYLVRHGESVANRDSIVSGHLDTELTDEGKAQALKTGRELSHIRFDAAYSSDLKRATHTAELIWGKPVPEHQQVFELRERSFGALEGKPEAHIQKLHQDQKHLYESLSEEEQWSYSHAPDIESDHVLSTRFLAALEQVAKQNTGKTILLAAHGGAIRTLLIKLGYLPAKKLPPGSFGNAGYVKLTYTNGRFSVDKVVGIKKDR